MTVITICKESNYAACDLIKYKLSRPVWMLTVVVSIAVENTPQNFAMP
jgi:hypothetical protein